MRHCLCLSRVMWTIIGERAFPASVAAQRKKLAERVESQGYDHFIDSVAYTWFNRMMAIRYMELHGYLDHGYRVLSHPDGESIPEILQTAERVELPGLDTDRVVDLKLDGGKDEELYQLLCWPSVRLCIRRCRFCLIQLVLLMSCSCLTTCFIQIRWFGIWSMRFRRNHGRTSR